MREHRIKGRVEYRAAPGEIAMMFRRIAADLNTTRHPLRDIDVSIGYWSQRGYASIMWRWWEVEAPAPYHSPQRRIRADRVHFSVPYRGQLPYAFEEAAAWIEVNGAIRDCEVYVDGYSGWWVLTVVWKGGIVPSLESNSVIGETNESSTSNDDREGR